MNKFPSQKPVQEQLSNRCDFFPVLVHFRFDASLMESFEWCS